MSTLIRNIFITIMLLTVIVGYDIAHTPSHVAMAQDIVSPTITPSPTPSPLPAIPTDIVGYVSYKFGDHAGEALELLRCENKTLDPYARNDNRVWGGVGVDRGYWQINNVYHPYVSDWCASDVKCSTDYAYRMWKNDGESFKRWTCHRTLGL